MSFTLHIHKLVCHFARLHTGLWQYTFTNWSVTVHVCTQVFHTTHLQTDVSQYTFTCVCNTTHLQTDPSPCTFSHRSFMLHIYKLACHTTHLHICHTTHLKTGLSVHPGFSRTCSHPVVFSYTSLRKCALLCFSTRLPFQVSKSAEEMFTMENQMMTVTFSACTGTMQVNGC